jgi:flagella basal body P-ring formation protein FlgA
MALVTMPARSHRLIVALSCAAASVLLPGRAASAGWIYNEGEAPVRAAIIESVRARMGATVDVTIGSLTIREAASGGLVAPLAAVPDAGSRTGGFVRFVLYDGRTAAATAGATRPAARRVGTADAEIFVAAEQVKARRTISRGQTIGAEDVESARGDVGRVPMKMLPGVRMTIGAKALRPIAEGDRIAAAMIAAPALVKSGDAVQTIVRIGSLEAHGVAIAAQNGTLGAEIRLVNASSRRSLRGRVVGEREVEVMHEH